MVTAVLESFGLELEVQHKYTLNHSTTCTAKVNFITIAIINLTAEFLYLNFC